MTSALSRTFVYGAYQLILRSSYPEVVVLFPRGFVRLQVEILRHEDPKYEIPSSHGRGIQRRRIILTFRVLEQDNNSI